MNRLVKALNVMLKPAYWPAFARGVAPTLEHTLALRNLSPNTIIDVGANRGQFSLLARQMFPAAKIYAFEPLDKARSTYELVVSQPTIVYSYALSDANQPLPFFLATRSDSSSLYHPGPLQEAAYAVKAKSTITVQSRRLEDIMSVDELTAPVLLKLDVQGAELNVLRGAGRLLQNVDAIFSEASFVPLYTHQPMAGELISFLSDSRFALRGVYNISSTRALGQTQCDCLFVRQ